MRIVVLGATGNVGTSVLRSLRADDTVERVIGVARRRPGVELSKVEWRTADIAADDLDPLFAGGPLRIREFLTGIGATDQAGRPKADALS